MFILLLYFVLHYIFITMFFLWYNDNLVVCQLSVKILLSLKSLAPELTFIYKINQEKQESALRSLEKPSEIKDQVL